MQVIRILIVDDEPDLLKLLARRLKRRDMEVCTVESGRAALEAVKAADFDIVVLDMKMPGMDGLETLSRLKELNADLQVIILSGHADAETAMRGMDLGAFDYMIKPVAVEDLLFKIHDAVRAGRGGNRRE